MEQGKSKVLIIDDDSRNIFALSMVLRAKGFNCASAPGAAEGIRLLKEDRSIAIVLMDMMMPGMDGYQAMAEMRKDSHTARIPVIAVTAQARAGDKEKCLLAGAADYISKPVDVDVLLDILNKYLN